MIYLKKYFSINFSNNSIAYVYYKIKKLFRRPLQIDYR